METAGAPQRPTSSEVVESPDDFIHIDDTFITPSPKRTRLDLDESFDIETPQRRSSGELVVGRSMFVGDTLQVDAQINQFDICVTPNCTGKYILHNIELKGLGGAVNMTYECSGCDNTSVIFESSVTALSGKPVIMKAMQVASICAGLTYTHYLNIHLEYMPFMPIHLKTH